MIKIIILDFDDTLIDNKLFDFQSFKQTSIKLDYYVPKLAEISNLRKKYFLAKEIIKWLIKKSKNNNAIKFWEEREKFLESKESLKYISLRPYSRLFLKKLKKRNIIVIIATLRKNKKILEMFLKKEHISCYIDSIYNLKYNKIETRKFSNAIKIKQNMIKQIQKSYDLKSNEIFSIGDSLADYEAARKCKINHVILKIDKKFHKISPKNVFSFKELNSRIESIIRQELLL